MFLFYRNNLFKKLFIVTWIIVLSFFVFGQGALAQCEPSDANHQCYGLDQSTPDDLKRDGTLSATIGTVVGALLSFIGVLFFLLMIYGGFLWMTAQGNEQQVEKAKNLIISAIIGIVVVMSAYAITAYIGGWVGQTD